MSDLVARTLSAARERARDVPRAELRARGVVPTPAELARHGVARLDQLLRAELSIEEGLASERVVILDPAVGTGVWLAALLEHTRARGARSRLLGLDTDPDALTVVEQLLAQEAARQGASLTLACANTLELAAPFPDTSSVRVILGNPPWAARSLSRGGALSDAWLSEFRHDHLGVPLGERRAGVLSDDYVRFFRWALEQARHAQAGAALCLATNGSFLDGPVHRGMRAALLEGFDRLELLDLGGNSLLSREQAGAAARDQSLFGVRVGAAITWAVRRPATTRGPERAGRVCFGALRGTLSEKLQALVAAPPRLTEHQPCAPWFRFRPGARSTAQAGFSLAQAFPFQREGVQTNRDAHAIATSRAELERRIEDLAHGRLRLPALRHFDPARAQRVLRDALERAESCIAPLSYRPLDDRWFITLPPMCHRPRSELQRAVAVSSSCLLAVRKDRGEAAFNLFAATRTTADACFLSTRSSCRTRVFPSHAPDGTDNLAPRIADQLGERLGHQVSAADLIAYALAVLGSPRHRAEQQSALQLDYAHLPWPRDAAHFARALQLGAGFARVLSSAHVPDAIELEVCADLATGVALAQLDFQPEARTVSHQGRVLLRGVMPAWWSARVGHQQLVASALRKEPVSLPNLLDALARAAAWAEAERAADALQADERSADGG